MELELTPIEADYILAMRDRHRAERRDASDTMMTMIRSLFEPIEERRRIANMYERYRVREIGRLKRDQRVELFQFIYERICYRLEEEGYDEEAASIEAERIIRTGEYLPSLPQDAHGFYFESRKDPDELS